jgi:hypothetical protein
VLNTRRGSKDCQSHTTIRGDSRGRKGKHIRNPGFVSDRGGQQHDSLKLSGSDREGHCEYSCGDCGGSGGGLGRRDSRR